jgi:hypothetical protein
MALTFPEFLPFNEKALKHQRNAIVSLERELAHTLESGIL